MKKVILRTLKRTKSNSFSDADRGAICWSVWFARKSVLWFMSGVDLVHNKKMNVHTIDSNSESDE
jgi:hypothetical protein